MGSYWAYYELGWGGFWFWDPVENASFMPWLAGTALLHSAIVMEKRSALKIWTVLLAILTFSLSLLGTFLVRSGVLTSVHAFATDPSRGVFILCILTLFIGGSLALFALRAPTLTAGGLFQPISREGALVLNNLFLTTAAATVLVGTLYPLVVEALTGDKISVGAPFFNLTFGPLMVPLLPLVPFGPLLAWKRGDLLAAAQRLMVGLRRRAACRAGRRRCSSTAPRCFAALGIGLAAWLVLGALTDLALKAGVGRCRPARCCGGFAGLPRSMFGTALAHLGLGLTVLGVVGVLSFETENITDHEARATRPRSPAAPLRFDAIEPVQGPNYTEDRAHLLAARRRRQAYAHDRLGQALLSGAPDADDRGRHRDASASASSMSRSAIRRPTAAIVVRIWWKPMVTLIWLGALVMMAGGAVSLLDRRLRVGAPARRARHRQAGEAAA